MAWGRLFHSEKKECLRLLVFVATFTVFAIHRVSSIQMHGSISFASRCSRNWIPSTGVDFSSSFIAETQFQNEPSFPPPILVMMAKGDGKKKRQKKSASSSTPAPPPAPVPAAPRVSNDINIPIRRQIQYGKLNKNLRESGTKSFRQKKVVRTKYRKTWDEEEIELKAEERRRKGQDPDWDVILNRTSTSPLVIVDGYNIIHKWPRLQKHMRKNDPGRARQLLVEDLENLRSIKDWRIEVVFDGAGKDNRVGPLGDTGQRRATMADKATKKDVSKHGVRVIFTGMGIEADSYIEARCTEAKHVTKGVLTGSLIVATDDGMIRLAGQSAGAMCMSADRFVSELKANKKAVAFRVEAAMAKVNGERMRPEKLWGSNVFSTTGPKSHQAASQEGNTSVNKVSSRNSTDIHGIKGVQETEDGRTIYTGRFGRNALIIEDRRKKKKKNK